MTNQHSDHRDSSQWESEVNALLDGELDSEATEALKRAAEKDHALARVIIEAWQLQHGIESLGIEKAPTSLRRKLSRIPVEESGPSGFRTWLAGRNTARAFSIAGATAFAVFLTVGLMIAKPWQPSLNEIEQAMADLREAFEVLDRITHRTGQDIDKVVAMELGDGINSVVNQRLPGSETRTGSYMKYLNPDHESKSENVTKPDVKRSTEQSLLEDNS